MNRRTLLATGLALVGFGRRARAQVASPSPSIRYAPLTRPVKVPLESVAEAWRPAPFVAEARVRVPPPKPGQDFGAAGTSERRVLINGVLFRTVTGLSALCVTCPHEQCQVDLVVDEARLARMLGQTATHPLFECGCHSSVFDAADEGARLSGETPRGLYRFRIAGVRDDMVEITDIEEIALFEV